MDKMDIPHSSMEGPDSGLEGLFEMDQGDEDDNSSTSAGGAEAAVGNYLNPNMISKPVYKQCYFYN